MLTADQMRILPELFNDIADPRARFGSAPPFVGGAHTAAAATLCGMTGHKAIAGWAQDLGDKKHVRAWVVDVVRAAMSSPCESIIRNVLIRVDPAVRFLTAHCNNGTKLLRPKTKTSP
ncbi:MAG: hypothetical protein IPP01_16410 [Saprospiraceae bacterium]|nr:hypothetical protein [Saprospiraceae bacterium]